MNVYPGLLDACVAEFRPDLHQHYPGHAVAPNGSMLATTDYVLSGVFAREVLKLWI